MVDVVTTGADLAGVEGTRPSAYVPPDCATQLLECGAGIADISALLGHKNLATTARYTHVNMAYLKVQIARHPRV